MIIDFLQECAGVGAANSYVTQMICLWTSFNPIVKKRIKIHNPIEKSERNFVNYIKYIKKLNNNLHKNMYIVSKFLTARKKENNSKKKKNQFFFLLFESLKSPHHLTLHGLLVLDCVHCHRLSCR